MKKMKSAGTFYPENKNELINLIETFRINTPKYFSRAVIVPHAGYIYSGKLTAKGIQHINPNVKNIFIFAPSHYARVFGSLKCSYSAFETPLEPIQVNIDLLSQLNDIVDCELSDEAFEKEHSIEVLLPLIKYFLPKSKIIPILYGCEDFKNISKIIEHFYGNEENAFIISSDLSHFYPEKDAYKIDNYTAKMIEENNTKDFEIEQACGAVGICGLIDFAKNNDFSLIRIGLINSANVSGNSSRVVGYGSWILYEGEKNKYLKEFYRNLIIKICKNSIMSGLQLGNADIENYDCVLEENGASFVTLEINENLRGCIGSIYAFRPLISDLMKNAHAAAFSDTRFKSLTKEEYNYLDIKVSLLSKPKRVEFSTQKELIDSITPLKDGIIIRDGQLRGVFLPDVWEMLPDKKTFLEELKLKAGMDKNYFSESMEVFKFYTTKIE